MAGRRYLSDKEEAYLAHLIGDVDPTNKKVGLQLLCKRYRTGHTIRHVHTMRQLVLGAVYNDDPKVVRWVLNALALLGRRDDIELVVDTIARKQYDIDILSSGVAALFSLERPDKAEKLMAKRGIPLEGATLLASAQSAPDYAERVRLERVNVDHVSDAEIRLALILVGLNKAPPNTFSIKHDNRHIVGALNKHHEKTVAQYSVWAISENAAMSLADLTVPLADIESLAENVRGWVYRLIAEDSDSAPAHVDYIKLGSEEFSSVARHDLAAGLSDTYFDGLEEITLDWLSEEDDDRVRQRLLEHMAGAADKCESYQEPVVHAYQMSGVNSLLRARIESAARDTSLARKLKLIQFEYEQPDLLLELQERMGPRSMVHQDFRGAHIGGVSGSGDVNIQTLQMLASTNIDARLRPVLSELTNAIANSGLDAETIGKGQQLVQEVAAKQDKGAMQTLLGWMKGIREGLEAAGGAGKGIVDLIESASAVTDLL